MIGVLLLVMGQKALPADRKHNSDLGENKPLST